jgi:hypothetical protein
MAEDTRKPREPWKGYAAAAEDERKGLLQKKVQDSLDKGDPDYAFALAAAAFNYELVLSLQEDEGHSPTLASAAGDLHDDAGSWQAS